VEDGQVKLKDVNGRTVYPCKCSCDRSSFILCKQFRINIFIYFISFLYVWKRRKSAKIW